MESVPPRRRLQDVVPTAPETPVVEETSGNSWRTETNEQGAHVEDSVLCNRFYMVQGGGCYLVEYFLEKNTPGDREE